MTPEEKRRLLKREQLKEAMAADEFTQAQEPQRTAGAPDNLIDPLDDAEALGMGTLQGGTFDFGDEMAGAAMTGADLMTGRGPLLNAPDYYRSNRDRVRSYLDAKRKKSPKSFFAGEVIGAALPTSKVTGLIGAGGRAKAATEALRLEGEASKALQVSDAYALAKKAEAAERKAAGLGSFGRGARDGAIQGYGASNSDSLDGDLGNAAIGAGLGGAINKATGVVDPKAVRERANEKALKSAGAMTKEFRQLSKRGFADDTGRWINENIIDSPFMGLEEIKDKAAGHKESAGAVIGNIVDGADKLREQAKQVIREKVLSQPGVAAQGQSAQIENQINQAVDREYGFSMANVAARIRAMTQRDGGIATAHSHFPRLQALAEVFDQIGGPSGSSTLRNGLQNKTQSRKLLRDVDNLGEEYKQEVYDIISDELEQSVGRFDRLSETMAKYTSDPVADTVKRATGSARPALPVGDAVGLPTAKPVAQDIAQEGRDSAKSFRDANRDYARAATTEKMAENRLGNVQSNRDFGLTTAIAGQTGFLTGGPGGALALGAANNFGRKYGSSSQAFVFHRLANFLEKRPEAFGKYAPTLRTALARGGSAFLMTHYLLSQKDPQYAQFSEQLMQGDNP